MSLQNMTVDCRMEHMVIWKPLRKAGSNTLRNKNLPSVLKETKKRSSLTFNSMQKHVNM